MELVLDRQNMIAGWVCRGLGFDTSWLGPNFTVGIAEEGRMLGGVIFNDWRPGTDVWWTIYTESPRWCSRKVLRYLFFKAFEEMGCRRISLLVDVTNGRCLKLVRRLGFKCEGRLRRFREDGKDCYIFGMLKSECKWRKNNE